MRTLVTKNGNDRFYTPEDLGLRILNHFKPFGMFLEPCIGDGKGFWCNLDNVDCNNLDGANWCEIDKDRDFFDYSKKVDWIITNPPYSLFSKFLEHSFSLSNNVVYLCLIPAVFFKKRLRLAKEYGFGVKEIIFMDTPKSFPQFGMQLGCVHWEKDFKGGIKVTDWRV